MQPITLGAPNVSGGRISISIDPGDAKPYLPGREFWVDYGDLDVTTVAPPVALLPALGTVVPVAIALGLSVHAPVVDYTFGAQVETIADTMRAMYPHFAKTGFSLSGPLATERNVTTDADGAALLYSGGLDSLTSLLRHRPSVECIVSIWGADVEIEDNELWCRLQAIIDRAPTRGSTHRVVARSNLRQVVDNLRLNRSFGHDFAATDWWGGAHHGLGLVTLVAPVAHTLRLSKVIVASSHWREFNLRWGSKPELDNQIKWTGGSTVHDAFELDRQQKIQHIIAPWIAQGNDLSLAVCYQVNRRGADINCGHCEKCMRTISGLLTANIDPTRAGVPVSAESLASWRSRCEHHEVRFNIYNVEMWRAIQRRIDATNPALTPYQTDYLEWLKKFDLMSLVEDSCQEEPAIRKLAIWRYHAERLAHRLPYRVRRALRGRLL